MELLIREDTNELAYAFAKLIGQQVDAKSGTEVCSIALSGGSSPKALFKQLVKIQHPHIQWNKIQVFWSDERCVSPDNDNSNYKMARKYLLDKVNMSASTIFRIKGENDPVIEAARYEQLVKENVPAGTTIPVFDIVMLGLGEDGHIASIFPQNKQLFFNDRLFEISQHPFSEQMRITATGKVINNAKITIFLVTGEKKAEVLSRIIDKKPGWEKLPASFVKPENGQLIWLLDKEAAKKIDRNKQQIYG